MNIITLLIGLLYLVLSHNYATAQTCSGGITDTLLFIDFGSGNNPGPTLPNVSPGATTGLTYTSVSGNPAMPLPFDGFYTITNNVPGNGAWFLGDIDHTPNDFNGYFAFYNASPNPGEFYRQTVNNVCELTTYTFSAWIANALNPAMLNGVDPSITFSIESTNGTVLASYSTGNITETNTFLWQQFGFSFVAPIGVNTIVLKLVNNNIGGSANPGNDLAIDDILFTSCKPIYFISTADGRRGTVEDCDSLNVTLKANYSTGNNYTNPYYLWQYSADNGNTWTTLGTTGTPTFAVPMVHYNYQYRFFVAGSAANLLSPSCRTVSDIIIFKPRSLNASITITDPIDCPNDTGELTASYTTNNNSGNYSYMWDYNPANNLTTFNTTEGLHNVIITDVVHGCKDTASINIQHLYANPFVAFSAQQACMNTNVVILNNSGVLPPSTIATYSWDFGTTYDATITSSNLQVPTNLQYTTAGVKKIILLVESDHGCKVKDSLTFIVISAPDFTFSNKCKDEQVSFTNLTGGIGPFTWDFGVPNANSTATNPVYNYNTAGIFTVTLTVGTGGGACSSTTHLININEKPDADFIATPTCIGVPVNFVNTSTINGTTIISQLSWDFNYTNPFIPDTDGFTNITHNYPTLSNNYFAALVATASNGCKDTIIKPIILFPRPVANYTVDSVCFGKASTFINQSAISSGSIVQQQLNFGDQTSITTTLPQETHNYQQAGIYPSSLLVISDKGCRDSITKQVIVNAVPQVVITSDTTKGCEPLCVHHQSAITLATTPPSSIISYKWSTSADTTNANPTLCYLTQNNQTTTYSVDLTVRTNKGCTSTTSPAQLISVYPKPVANFTVSPKSTSIIDPLFSIQDHSQFGSIITWSLANDKTLTTLLNASFQYQAKDTGTYTLMEIVTSDHNCTDTAYEEIYVKPADFFYLPNAFTPNNDGVNDLFFAKGSGIKEMNLTIFNRWGELICELNDISEKWDGTDIKRNKICQQDLYAWKLNYKGVTGNSYKQTGTVTLLK